MCTNLVCPWLLLLTMGDISKDYLGPEELACAAPPHSCLLSLVSGKDRVDQWAHQREVHERACAKIGEGMGQGFTYNHASNQHDNSQ